MLKFDEWMAAWRCFARCCWCESSIKISINYILSIISRYLFNWGCLLNWFHAIGGPRHLVGAGSTQATQQHNNQSVNRTNAEGKHLFQIELMQMKKEENIQICLEFCKLRIWHVRTMSIVQCGNFICGIEQVDRRMRVVDGRADCDRSLWLELEQAKCSPMTITQWHIPLEATISTVIMLWYRINRFGLVMPLSVRQIAMALRDMNGVGVSCAKTKIYTNLISVSGGAERQGQENTWKCIE